MARMPQTVVDALGRVKGRGRDLMTGQLVHGLCRSLGHRWRNGPLNPANTIALFLQQILHGNTACTHTCRLGDLAVTASAYCQARRRLPLAVFEALFAAITARFLSGTARASRWLGHRVFLLDGSSFSMPDAPELAAHFGRPTGQKKGCGFPVAHLMALCDLGTGLVIDIMASPLYRGDLTQGVRTHRSLQSGDVVVGDRVFGTWGYMALVLQENLHAVVRAHQRLKLSFKPKERGHKRGTYCRLYALGEGDQVIEWFKPRHRPRWMSAEQFQAMSRSIIVRVVQYTVRRRGFRTRQVTLLTTLTDHERYPKSALAELYGRRWEIETNFRDLKQTMGLRTLRCKTVDGVRKELMMYAIAYNLVRMACFEAAGRQGVDPRRISFIDALRSEQCPPGAPGAPDAGDPPPPLLVNPHRPDRVEPRLTKRRPAQQSYLTVPRAQARQRLLQQSLAA